MSKPNNKRAKYRKSNNPLIFAAVLVLLIMVAGLYLQQKGQVFTVQASGNLPREVSIAEAARIAQRRCVYPGCT
jgi:hypothetical protein